MSLKELILEFSEDKQLDDLEKIDRERIVYAQLKRKADSEFKKIASGSARRVYEFKDDKVIKVAHNKKGLAQNERECDLGTDKYTEEILTRVFYCSENYSFIISEKADKMTVSDFKQITGIEYSLFTELVYSLIEYHSNRQNKVTIPDGLTEDIWENEFVYDFTSFLSNYDLWSGAGDYTRPSSYGIVERNGQKMIVITDYGLTEDILKKYY